MEIIKLIDGNMIDDFFFFGFIGGIVGYAYYLYTNRKDPRNHVSLVAGVIGIILSGSIGGLLAIVIDRRIELSIVVGLLNQLIYMALIKGAKNGDFWDVIKDIIIKYLTAGKGR